MRANRRFESDVPARGLVHSLPRAVLITATAESSFVSTLVRDARLGGNREVNLPGLSKPRRVSVLEQHREVSTYRHGTTPRNQTHRLMAAARTRSSRILEPRARRLRRD